MERQAGMKKAMTALALFLGMEALLMLGTCAALGIGLSEMLAQRLLLGVVGGFGFLLTVLILLLLRFLELPEVVQSRGAGVLLSILFPVASLLILAVAVYAAREIDGVAVGAAVFGFVLLIANGAILYLLRLMARHAKEEQERALLRQQMEIQTGSILALEKSYRSQRQATHEFRNQLQTIHDLLARGAREEALRYVEQLQGMQTTRVFAVNTHHPILDAVLNQKYQAAKELDVDFQFRVNDLSRLELETDALVVLFSNLLDNAVEGCARLPEGRMIRCSILLSDSLYISIRNTSPTVVMNGKEIPTTKEPKHEHGFGLVSVRRILEDLGAEYTFHYADGWFEFVAEIPC